MKRRTFISMILPAAAVLSGCGYKPYYFIQMADTQFGMIDGGKDCPPPTKASLSIVSSMAPIGTRSRRGDGDSWS